MYVVDIWVVEYDGVEVCGEMAFAHLRSISLHTFIVIFIIINN